MYKHTETCGHRSTGCGMHMATVVLCGKVLRKGALPVAPHIRCITVWPQWPHDEETRSAKPVGDSKFRWPLNAPKDPEPGAVMTEDEVRALRKKIYHKIWQDRILNISQAGFSLPLRVDELLLIQW